MTLSHISLMMFALAAPAEKIRDLEDIALMERQSEMRTQERFESSFSEVRAATSNCPYGNEAAAKEGHETSFSCHGFAKGEGTTCPALQAKRIKTVRAFQINHHASFLEGVGGYPLSPVFDKTKAIRGDETHEELVQLQIKGLMHEDIVHFEDKIYLKALAERLGIPTTKLYFGAHKDDWNRTNFKEALDGLCTKSDIDKFFMKPTHLAWSKGIRIVKDFRKKYCEEEDQHKKEQQMMEYVTHIEQEILNKRASEADAHLRLYLVPGVTVESLFSTGGASIQPLEAKVQVLWGKVHHMFLFGMDHRGCRVHVGAWQIYGDKTGWDLNGIIKPSGGNDEFGDKLLDEAFQPMVNYAERFARSLEADFMRVDFFLRPPDKENLDWKIEMNECESVTGAQHTFERRGIEAIWRDGYIMSRLAMTPYKYAKIRNNTQAARDGWRLDA